MQSVSDRIGRPSQARFETELARVFGAERVEKFSDEHKAWLRQLWDAAFHNGMERQRELEIGAVIDKHVQTVMQGRNASSVEIHIGPETPAHVHEPIRQYVEKDAKLPEF